MKDIKKSKEIIRILKKHKTSDKTINEINKTILCQDSLVPIDYTDVVNIIKSSKRLETKVFTVPSKTNKISNEVKDLKKAKGAVVSVTASKKDFTWAKVNRLITSLCEKLNKNAVVFWAAKCDNKLKNNIRIGYIYSF